MADFLLVLGGLSPPKQTACGAVKMRIDTEKERADAYGSAFLA
jgi:hypothetical protein